MSAAYQITMTWDASRIYTDAGTGAHQPLSVWEPKLPDGYYMIGHFGQRDHDKFLKGGIFIVKPLDDNAFAAPVSYEQMWNDKKSGGDQDCAFWRVVAPPGYVALGDLITTDYNPPNNLTDKYACIRSDHVVQGKFAYELWGGDGSGASKDGSMWAVATTTVNCVAAYMKVQSGHTELDSVYAQCLKMVPAQQQRKTWWSKFKKHND